MSEVEDQFKHLMSHKGVAGIFTMNNDGIAVKSTMDALVTNHYAANVHEYVQKCKKVVKELDSSNDLTMLRIRTTKHELMVAPDKEYMLVVVQKPSVEY